MSEAREIAGYDGEYLVDEFGTVTRRTLTYRNRYSAVVLQKSLPSGYRQVWLGGREGRNYYVHRLVALAFLGPAPSESHEVAHFDGDKTNNHVSNLRWATRAENEADKRRLGECPKLTQCQVNQIRSRKSEGSTSLSREFGVVPSHIRRIIRGEMWS